METIELEALAMRTGPHYEVVIKGPDGQVRTVLIPANQAEFFAAAAKGDPYVSAAWLAYCDFWAKV